MIRNPTFTFVSVARCHKLSTSRLSCKQYIDTIAIVSHLTALVIIAGCLRMAWTRFLDHCLCRRR
jgi:hypothetical protein